MKTKKTKKMVRIQAFFKKGLDVATSYLKALEHKKSKGSFAYWAEWHAIDYIHWEMVKEYWTTLNASLAKLVAEGKTEDEIIKWIGECRDQFVRDILRTTPQRSTNQLGNIIFAERIEVWRQIGADCLNSDSLEYLLIELKRM